MIKLWKYGSRFLVNSFLHYLRVSNGESKYLSNSGPQFLLEKPKPALIPVIYVVFFYYIVG